MTVYSIGYDLDSIERTEEEYHKANEALIAKIEGFDLAVKVLNSHWYVETELDMRAALNVLSMSEGLAPEDAIVVQEVTEMPETIPDSMKRSLKLYMMFT